MRKSYLLLIATLIIITNSMAQTKIIAHRGAWKEFDLPENSIAALQKAITLKAYGSEFDVRRTKDGVLVVNHDPTYYEDTIENKNYKELNEKKLSNGEDLPTLRNYFIKGTEEKHNTLLICEIKAGITNPALDELTTSATLALAKELGIEDRVVYISFRFEILKWIKAIHPSAKVLYLEADQKLEDIVAAGIDGINYHFSNFKEQPILASKAIEQKLDIGSWTVNELADFELLKKQGVTLITTNYPALFLKQNK